MDVGIWIYLHIHLRYLHAPTFTTYADPFVISWCSWALESQQIGSGHQSLTDMSFVLAKYEGNTISVRISVSCFNLLH